MSPVSRLNTWKPAFCSLLVLLACMLTGCNHLRSIGHDYVYVVAQQTYLHDRVAPVSNLVGEVKNGQKLEVVERSRRFLKVKTEKNEIGWLEQHSIIDQKIYDGFAQLAEQHKNDTPIATGTLRYLTYLHLTPGRRTERYYLLQGNDKIQLLARASVPKVAPGAPVRKKTKPATAAPAPDAPPPVLEDWWLVRDAQGRAGWLLSSSMDVDAPDEIAQYAEGQRIIGAYVLNRVHDENVDANGQPVVSEKPQYVAVMTPMKSGQPFDFNQVRVFTWNPRRHRYETAYRLHPIAGFLPVKVTQAPVQGVAGQTGNVPQFSIQLGSPENVKIDPETGKVSAANPRTINFQLIQTVVRRVGPDMNPIELAKQPEDKKGAKGKKKR